jgi:hypothetical protein
MPACQGRLACECMPGQLWQRTWSHPIERYKLTVGYYCSSTLYQLLLQHAISIFVLRIRRASLAPSDGPAPGLVLAQVAKDLGAPKVSGGGGGGRRDERWGAAVHGRGAIWLGQRPGRPDGRAGPRGDARVGPGRVAAGRHEARAWGSSVQGRPGAAARQHAAGPDGAARAQLLWGYRARGYGGGTEMNGGVGGELGAREELGARVVTRAMDGGRRQDRGW